MELEYRSPAEEEFRSTLETVHLAFGDAMRDDDVERHGKVMPLDRIIAAFDDGGPVGVAASYPFDVTVPGGQLPTAGISWVAVLPSHRRRGVLRELMRRQLEDVHRRGEPLAALWASESPIYGRYGYGIAAPNASLNAERAGLAFRDDPGPEGRVRLVGMEEATARFPPIYERVRVARPGMTTRSELWWKEYRLADPEHWREGTSPKYYALLELDGEDAGYATYRIKSKWEHGTPQGEVRVFDAFATSPAATRELWRFLFGIDLIARVKMDNFDPASPLFLMVVDPRRLHLGLSEGVWLRLVDVGAALRARSYADGEPLVLEVRDQVCPWNAGRWEAGGDAARTRAEPDLALDAADLASAYFGTFTFEQLAAAGRVEERTPGALARATALFRTPVPPHCPEDF